MKARERFKRKSEVRLLITTGWRNCLKISRAPAESIMHRNMKYLIACYCLDHALDFQTEATFRVGGRADLIIEDWGVAIEVLDSETKERFAQKEYPLPVLPIRSSLSPIELHAMLDDIMATDGAGAEHYRRKFLKEPMS